MRASLGTWSCSSCRFSLLGFVLRAGLGRWGCCAGLVCDSCPVPSWPLGTVLFFGDSSVFWGHRFTCPSLASFMLFCVALLWWRGLVQVLGEAAAA